MSSYPESAGEPRKDRRRRLSLALVAGAVVTLAGCAWTQGDQVLTVDEYRMLEERWADERERRLEALLDERIDPLLDHEERLQTLERRSEGILVGLRELEAAQRRANREARAGDDDADDGDDDDDADDGDDGDESGDDGERGDDQDASQSDDGDGEDSDDVDLEREPDALPSAEPLVFGSKECIGLPEQGLVLRARIDSGANTASLGAVDIREFERDGDEWVRFRIPYKGVGEGGVSGSENDGDDGGDDDIFDDVMDVVDGDSESENEEAVGLRVEARVYRRVTIVQASGEEERVVVRLPTRIGPLDQRVEYTLADRGGMTFPVLLGRRMLQDLAVVDVAREYVQPCPPD